MARAPAMSAGAAVIIGAAKPEDVVEAAPAARDETELAAAPRDEAMDERALAAVEEAPMAPLEMAEPAAV